MKTKKTKNAVFDTPSNPVAEALFKSSIDYLGEALPCLGYDPEKISGTLSDLSGEFADMSMMLFTFGPILCIGSNHPGTNEIVWSGFIQKKYSGELYGEIFAQLDALDAGKYTPLGDYDSLKSLFNRGGNRDRAVFSG